MTQQMEAKFVNEWIMLNYPNRLNWRRVRLGPLPTTGTARMFMVTGRWVDAVIKDGDTILIVEAKLRPTAAAIGQLQLYERLFPETPMFEEYKALRRRLVLLTTREDMQIKSMAIDNNIDYVVYRPKWIVDYLARGIRG